LVGNAVINRIAISWFVIARQLALALLQKSARPIEAMREVIRMLFVVTYRKKHASSKSRKSFFAEHNEQPSVEQIHALVNSISAGNFAEKTIALQKCPGFDTDELIKAGISVFRFEPEAQLAGTGAGLEATTSRF
jgi:hypothetical protein